MDAEDNTTSAASAEAKPAAKPRATRKPAARKSAAKAAAAPAVTEGAPAPAAEEKAARKPRARKTAATAAEPAAAEPVEVSKKKTERKPRARKNAAPAAEPAAAPQPESKPAPATPPRPESKPAEEPAPAPTATPQPKPAPAPQAEQGARRNDGKKPDRQGGANQPRNNQPSAQDKDNWEREPDPRDVPAPEPAPGFALPETVGGNEGSGGSKNRRKRRRNRRNRDGENVQQQVSAAKVDPDELVRRAWKIYLGEVTEEGLALMDDRTAAEASRRAFRVAELFLQEAARYRQPVQRPAQVSSAGIDLDVAEDNASVDEGSES